MLLGKMLATAKDRIKALSHQSPKGCHLSRAVG